MNIEEMTQANVDLLEARMNWSINDNVTKAIRINDLEKALLWALSHVSCKGEENVNKFEDLVEMLPDYLQEQMP